MTEERKVCDVDIDEVETLTEEQAKAILRNSINSSYNDESNRIEWWIKEEVDKYKNKQVKLNDSNLIWTVVEVFWIESEEVFIYWVEDSKRNLQKAFEHNIELIS